MLSFKEPVFDTRQGTVLLISSDHESRRAITNVLSAAGFAVAEADDGGAGLEIATDLALDAVILDFGTSDLAGKMAAFALRHSNLDIPVIVIDATSRCVDGDLSKLSEYITRPFSDKRLVELVRRAVALKRDDCSPTHDIRRNLSAIMGRSAPIRRLIDQIEAVAQTDYSVLIQGETGAGKEVVARNLHRFGRRSKRQLIVVDCGAVPESLLDSEFFGHEKGAFTGATDRRRGRFEAAAFGGTIFLDEIGNLPLSGQKALLRTIEERKIRRVGGSELIDLDMRIIAATNDDLRQSARAGSFRQDLFFRLAEYVITIPPLRSRGDDLEFLARQFIAEARVELGRGPLELDSDAIDLMREYHWPGNVRELRNLMRRAALTISDRLRPDDLRDNFFEDRFREHAVVRALHVAPLRQRVRERTHEVEREAILDALERAGGNKAKAARFLGVDYKTYRVKLKSLSAASGT